MLTDQPRKTPGVLMLMGSSLLIAGRLQRGSVTVVDGVVREVLAESPDVEAADNADVSDSDSDSDGAELLPITGRTLMVDTGDQPVCPAPVDLHFHGAGGVSVSPVGNVASLDRVLGELLSETTWALDVVTGAPLQPLLQPYRYLATLPVPSDPPADIVTHAVAAAHAISMVRGSRCVGLRIEGLFLNPARAGVWPPATFRLPDIALLDELIDGCKSGGMPLRIIDVAPELPGALKLIRHAVSRGLVVSLAHTDATYDQAMAGIDAGATLATHLFNAMSPIHHRGPGAVAAALTDDRVTCELILDGHHVHPAVVSLALRCAGARRIAAVSDASPVTGLGDGTHNWNGMPISSKDGALTDGVGRLAGAGCLLDRAAATLHAAGASVTATLMALSVTPLRVLDPQRSAGLQVGDNIWCPGTCVTRPAG